MAARGWGRGGPELLINSYESKRKEAEVTRGGQWQSEHFSALREALPSTLQPSAVQHHGFQTDQQVLVICCVPRRAQVTTRYFTLKILFRQLRFLLCSYRNKS